MLIKRIVNNGNYQQMGFAIDFAVVRVLDWELYKRVKFTKTENPHKLRITRSTDANDPAIIKAKNAETRVIRLPSEFNPIFSEGTRIKLTIEKYTLFVEALDVNGVQQSE